MDGVEQYVNPSQTPQSDPLWKSVYFVVRHSKRLFVNAASLITHSPGFLQTPAGEAVQGEEVTLIQATENQVGTHTCTHVRTHARTHTVIGA